MHDFEKCWDCNEHPDDYEEITIKVVCKCCEGKKCDTADRQFLLQGEVYFQTTQGRLFF